MSHVLVGYLNGLSKAVAILTVTAGVAQATEPCDNPEYLGSYDTGIGSRCVYVDGDVAYVSSSLRGFKILDISDPAIPIQIGEFGSGSVGAAFRNELVYLASGNSGLRIIDISDPASPQLVGEYDTPGDAWDVDVENDFAYVADGNGMSVQVIDVSDPTQPTFVGSYGTQGKPVGITVIEEIAYVSNFQHGLLVLDVSNPEFPNFHGSRNTPGHGRSVVVVGDLVYMAAGYGGLQIFDVSNLPSISYVGQYETPGYVWDIETDGNALYLAEGDSGSANVGRGLVVMEISDPLNPIVTGSIDAGHAYGVAVQGDTAFLADYNLGLQSFDIRDRCGPCVVDLSNDGVLNFVDISVFLWAYGESSMLADFSSDGVLNFLDVSVFLSAFAKGCP